MNEVLEYDCGDPRCPNRDEIAALRGRIEAIEKRLSPIPWLLGPAPQGVSENMRMVLEMEAISGAFYAHALRVGAHRFLELNGIARKLIGIAKRTLSENRDWIAGQDVAIEVHGAMYLGEKFSCMFGPSLRTREERDAFIAVAFSHIPEK